MVDDLDRYLARLRRVEGLARRAVELRPPALVDLRPEGFLQLVVRAFLGVLAAVQEVGVADVEALPVVVGIDEPAGDVVRGCRLRLGVWYLKLNREPRT